MNYLAHGRHLLDRPYALAGSALPDWLGACDRGARLRPHRLPESAGGVEGELAEGVRRHLADDAWFHRTRAFVEVTAAVTTRIRDAHPSEERLRAGFLGHVLAEMLLDGWLVRRDPDLPRRYYAALASVDADRVERIARPWLARRARGLSSFVRGFSAMRFLYDYADDAGLARRLGQVARRVGLPPLPAGFADVLPHARAGVEARAEELISPA